VQEKIYSGIIRVGFQNTIRKRRKIMFGNENSFLSGLGGFESTPILTPCWAGPARDPFLDGPGNPVPPVTPPGGGTIGVDDPGNPGGTVPAPQPSPVKDGNVGGGDTNDDTKPVNPPEGGNIGGGDKGETQPVTGDTGGNNGDGNVGGSDTNDGTKPVTPPEGGNIGGGAEGETQPVTGDTGGNKEDGNVGGSDTNDDTKPVNPPENGTIGDDVGETEPVTGGTDGTADAEKETVAVEPKNEKKEPTSTVKNHIALSREQTLEGQFFGGGKTRNLMGEKPIGMGETKPKYFVQRMFTTDKGFGKEFGGYACFATSILNELSEEYTSRTGKRLTDAQAITMMKAAVKSSGVLDNDDWFAYVDNPTEAANAMWKSIGCEGSWTTDTVAGMVRDVKHAIYETQLQSDKTKIHLVNTTDKENSVVFDVWDGREKNITELKNGGYGFDNREVVATRILYFNPAGSSKGK